MDLPAPACVGTFPKRTEPCPANLGAPDHVVEVCSVSTCISRGPEDWVSRWLHNALGFFDTPELAWRVVGDDRAAYDLYAYRVYPLEFDSGTVRPWRVPVSVTMDLGAFEYVGHDVVSRSAGTFCECSPLSCNGAAAEFAVNRHCLIDDAASALEAAKSISAGGWEPGPYHLFEVYLLRGASG